MGKIAFMSQISVFWVRKGHITFNQITPHWVIWQILIIVGILWWKDVMLIYTHHFGVAVFEGMRLRLILLRLGLTSFQPTQTNPP